MHCLLRCDRAQLRQRQQLRSNALVTSRITVVPVTVSHFSCAGGGDMLVALAVVVNGFVRSRPNITIGSSSFGNTESINRLYRK